MKKFRISQAAATLYDMGISFHTYGVMSDSSGVKLFDFYKTGWLAPQDAEKIRAIAPDCQIRESRAEYAPEQRGVYICFPKAAWYRLRAQGCAVSA